MQKVVPAAHDRTSTRVLNAPPTATGAAQPLFAPYTSIESLRLPKAHSSVLPQETDVNGWVSKLALTPAHVLPSNAYTSLARSAPARAGHA